MKNNLRRLMAMVLAIVLVSTVFTACSGGMKLSGTYERQNAWYDAQALKMPSSVVFEGYNAKIYYAGLIPLNSTYSVYKNQITFKFQITDEIINALTDSGFSWIIKKLIKKPSVTYTFEEQADQKVKIGDYIYKKVK